MASSASSSSGTGPVSTATSVPPHAGQRPYGKAKPSLRLAHEEHFHATTEPALQNPSSPWSSSPGSNGRRQRGHTDTPAGTSRPAPPSVTSSPPRWRRMAAAARRPAPMARMTVAPPVTMSPPANTPGRLVAWVTGSAAT